MISWGILFNLLGLYPFLMPTNPFAFLRKHLKCKSWRQLFPCILLFHLRVCLSLKLDLGILANYLSSLQAPFFGNSSTPLPQLHHILRPTSPTSTWGEFLNDCWNSLPDCTSLSNTDTPNANRHWISWCTSQCVMGRHLRWIISRGKDVIWIH